MDRTVFGLHPPTLGNQGLAEAVSQHAASWSNLVGVPVDLLISGIDKAQRPRQAAETV